MKTKERVYQQNAVSYCVNSKGRKIPPYKNDYTPTKKINAIQKIIKLIFR